MTDTARDRAAAMTTADLVEYLRSRPADYQAMEAAERMGRMAVFARRVGNPDQRIPDRTDWILAVQKAAREALGE